MSMNFVTFNQDYSHLAVGKSLGTDARKRLMLKVRTRYLKRFQNIHNGSILKMLRVEAGRYCSARDALFHILGRPHTFAAQASNH